MSESQFQKSSITSINGKWIISTLIHLYLFVGKVDLTGQFGQPVEVEKILKGLLKSMSRGFFIECGAFDGISLSNTLHFELKYNWTGIFRTIIIYT